MEPECKATHLGSLYRRGVMLFLHSCRFFAKKYFRLTRTWVMRGACTIIGDSHVAIDFRSLF